MNRSDQTFRHEAMTAEEVDSFLDEMLDDMFAELLDDHDISSNTDKIPDTGLQFPAER